MKGIQVLILLTAASVALLGMSVGAEDSTSRDVITVTGRSELVIVPDKATLTVTFVSEAELLEEVRAAHDRKLREAVRLVAALGVDSKYVQSGSHPRHWHWYSWRWYYRQNDNEYVIRHPLTIQLTELEKLEELYQGLMDPGGESFQVRFDSTRRHELRLQAYEDAVKAAHRKAETMSAALGQRVGRAVGIEENPERGARWGYYGNVATNSVRNAGGESADMDQFAGGQVSVQAYVEVTFILD